METVNETVHFGSDTELFTASGQRKYTNALERKRLLPAVRELEREDRTFALVLIYSGARISEALSATIDQVDVEGGAIAFSTLKQRPTAAQRRSKRAIGRYRQVPLPRSVIDALDLAHDLRSRQKRLRAERRRHPRRKAPRIWPRSRQYGYLVIKDLMRAANVHGPMAAPKGLRHGFAIHALASGVDIVTVSRWLGHSQLSTTQIYLQAMAGEDRKLASRMWKR